MSFKILFLLLFFCCFCACKNTTLESTATSELHASNIKQQQQQQVIRVKTLKLSSQPFKKQIISQGKIQAKYFSEVTFDLQERIEEVLVETGQRVKKGMILARLRDFEWQNQLQKIEYQIEQAKIKLEAKLISLGYTVGDSLSIPPAILKTARLESNLDGLEIEKSMVLYQLENTQIRAPISGIIAEVEAQAGNASSAHKKLCTIIDDRRLEAIFPVLEQELPLIRKGQQVRVKPLHQKGKSYKAMISTYLPQVDEQGMVQVFARLSGSDHQLLDGMNVSVYIEEEVSNQIVLPKSAVVDRQGRQVVFVHKDGQAHWQYVQIGLENSESYSILDGLVTGDEVIVSNNFHLSHMETVQVEK